MGVGALRDFDNGRFGAAAAIHADDLGQHAVAMQHFLHFLLGQEQVFAAFVPSDIPHPGRATLEQLGFAVFNGGVLCLALDSYDVHKLTKGAFSLTAGALDLLAGGHLAQYVDPKAPVYITLAPEEPPVFTLGAGTMNDPHLQLSLKKMHIGIYVYMYERYARLFEVSADISAGLNITRDDMTHELHIAVATGPTIDHFVQTYNELMPGVDFGDVLPGLINVALGALLSQQISFKEGQKFSEYVRKINEAAKGKIPADDEIAFERVKGPGHAEAGGEASEARIPYLLHAKTEVTGDELQDANVQIDPENRRPNVSFSMNPRGASLFEKLTGDNIGKRLAIVLDGILHSAPVIQSKIGGRGQITLGRGDNDDILKEAKDLAIVLRAGALPAQLDFLEQQRAGRLATADSSGAPHVIPVCYACDGARLYIAQTCRQRRPNLFQRETGEALIQDDGDFRQHIVGNTARNLYKDGPHGTTAQVQHHQQAVR